MLVVTTNQGDSFVLNMCCFVLLLRRRNRKKILRCNGETLEKNISKQSSCGAATQKNIGKPQKVDCRTNGVAAVRDCLEKGGDEVHCTTSEPLGESGN